MLFPLHEDMLLQNVGLNIVPLSTEESLNQFCTLLIKMQVRGSSRPP